MGSIAPIKSCPHCGSLAGFYTKEQAYGSIYVNYNFDGSEADNTELYNHVSCKGGKIAYCINCGKKLFKMSELKER